MGAIYLGKKLGLGGFEKEVVLKQLLPEYTEQPEFIDLFLREARLSASLDHANIVHTIDLVAAGSDFFIVMEYVKGGDLRTLLRRVKRRGKQWGPEAALFIGRELLSALAYAHAKAGPEGKPLNLIHRDVSPSNILLSWSGEVKLTDFGIAKANTHRSVFYRVKGKVGYMSPEQARGEPLDHRSDLYSCAVCLYEILTGERLFVGDLTMSPEQIYSQPIPPPTSKRRGLPAELDLVMKKALASDPEKRYQSAIELSEALLRVAHKNQLMYSAADLATHLRELCGEDPATWMHLESEEEEDEDRPATELLANPTGHSRLTQFTGREATSIVDAGTFVPRGASLKGLFSEVAVESWGPQEREHDAERALRPPREEPRTIEEKNERKSIRESQLAGRLRALPPQETARTPFKGAPLPDPRPSLITRRPRRGLTIFASVIALGIGVAAAVGLTRPELPRAEDEAPQARVRASAREDTPSRSSPVPRPEASAPKKDAPPRINEAQGGAPAGRGATLEIASTPIGSIVLLDGREQCVTPCRITSLPREPIHELTVRHEDYLDYTALVDLGRRTEDRLTALLRPRPGTGDPTGFLHVRTSKVAEIYLNGREIGSTTAQAKIPVRPGHYDLTLVRPRIGQRPHAEIHVQEGATVSLRLPFK